MPLGVPGSDTGRRGTGTVSRSLWLGCHLSRGPSRVGQAQAHQDCQTAAVCPVQPPPHTRRSSPASRELTFPPGERRKLRWETAGQDLGSRVWDKQMWGQTHTHTHTQSASNTAVSEIISASFLAFTGRGRFPGVLPRWPRSQGASSLPQAGLREGVGEGVQTGKGASCGSQTG